MKENQIAVQSIIQALQIQNEQNQLCIFPKAFVSLINDEKISLDQFANKTCYAIAGIAHPQTFFDLLKDLNIIVIPISFADHYHFSKNDFKTLTKHPVLMTEKDAVKCKSLGMENSYYLQMGSVMSDGLIKSLEQCLKNG